MPSRSSSSFHTINSDFELSFINKYLYMFLNAFLGCLPSNSPKILSRKKFIPSTETVTKVASKEIGVVSPARLLSNVFWESIDYASLSAVLGRPISVIEVGCGSGVYGERISKLVDIIEYTGVDIKENANWHLLDSSRFTFIKDTYENFGAFASTQNLIITQSALEHFENDITLFKMIDSYAVSCDFPVVSIQIMPSASSLYTFLWHGIRQYGKFHLNRLSAASSGSSQFRIYTLGGYPLNWFHFWNITLPQVLHRKPLISNERSHYFNLLLEAVKRDAKVKSSRFSVFTAVVILWNTDESDSTFISS